MVAWLSKWAQGIIVAIIISTIIELIVPNGSSKKYVKVVIGIYILFTIISPVLSKFKGDNFELNEILDTKKYEQELAKSDNTISSRFESNTNRTIKDIYISNLTTDIEGKLLQKGYKVINTNIKIKDDENYKIDKINIQLYKVKSEEGIKQKENVKKVEIEVNEIEINVNNANSRNLEKNNTDISKENQNILTESEKTQIREYLSETYNIATKDIEVS